MKRLHVFSINEATYRAKLDIDVIKSVILDLEDLWIWNNTIEDWQCVSSDRFEHVRKTALNTPNIYHFG